jgi:tripartite-type tricarboxylate transporter receptor subunit TctC
VPLPAQEKYPVRPIELIVPYAPGGGMDLMFRHLVKVIEIHKLVLVPITVVNKPGGSSGSPPGTVPRWQELPFLRMRGGRG